MLLYVSLTVSETTLTRVWSFYRIYVQATDPHYGTEAIQALQNDPNLGCFVVEGVATGRQLGIGSYGSVEEV